KVKLPAAAEVHAVNVGRALPGQVAGQLDRGDDQRAGALGDRYRVADVVRVAVGDHDAMHVQLVGFHRAAGGAAQERVHHYPLAIGFTDKRRVAQITDAHPATASLCLRFDPSLTPATTPDAGARRHLLTRPDTPARRR